MPVSNATVPNAPRLLAPRPGRVDRGDSARLRFERDLDGLLRQCGVSPAPRRTWPHRPRHGFWVGLSTDGISNRMRRVLEHVELHVGEVRTLDDLAEVAGLSRTHFAHRFHREVGETPWAYVRRVRDDQALRHLEAGVPPAEVAYRTGFSDQSHLTRSLRERYGRTPGAIREEGLAAGTTPASEKRGGNRKDVQDAEGETG